MKRRLLVTLMAVCLVVGLLPGRAWAEKLAQDQAVPAETEDLHPPGNAEEIIPQTDILSYGDLFYIVKDEVIEITRCLSSATSVDIPSQLDGYPVTSIGDRAFNGCRDLTSVSIPSGVTNIGEYAFYYCSGLTSVSIPSGVTNIGGYAFAGCIRLISVIIPNSVTDIGDYAFAGCSGLTSVTISNSVTDIGDSTFQSCSGLTSIIIPNSVTSIKFSAFYCCSGLTSVSIPGSVTDIGNYAFSGCSGLTSVIIPSSVTDIQDRAFSYCGNLTDVYYSGSEEDWAAIHIPVSGNEPLLDATIHYNSTGPDDLETKKLNGVLRTGDGCRVLWQCTYQVGEDAQPKNGKIKIFTSSTDTVDEELFLYNEAAETGFPYPWELEPYNLPKSAITSIQIVGEEHKQLRVPANAFRGYDQLKQVTLDCVSAVDNSAFADCVLLQSAAFSDTVKHIGANAFQNTDLRTIKLGRNVETIGENAFAGCANIKIRCYKDSAAHHYAAENSIPFELIDATISVPFYSKTGARTTELDIGWNWNLFQLPTYQYHHQLAALGMTLSAAAEEDTSTRAENLYKYLGFECVTPENYGSDFGFITWNGQFYPGAIFGYHKEKGSYIFAITVRGSTDFEDWMTNISSQGFRISAGNIYTQFNAFLNKNGLSVSDLHGKAKFLVTGHSLGGATANALTKALNDEYGIENVFSYTFAAPRPYTVWDAAKVNNVYNIYNVVNNEDLVPKLKNVWTLQRVGSDRYFHRDSTDGFYENFKLLTGLDFAVAGENGGIASAHDAATYMAYVLSRTNGIVSPVQTSPYIVVRIACPVDVEVYDSNNQVVGQIRDNQVITSSSDKIYAYAEGDEKYLVLIGEDDYTIKLVGTDTGTMTYSLYNVDGASQGINSQKIFERVVLTDGKQFTSRVSIWDKEDENIDTDNKTDVPDVKLYVLGDTDNPEKEVLPDGNGTEVPITTPDNPDNPDNPDDPVPAICTITFDPNGGSVAPTSARTGADGKLATLPTPTRTSYNFRGWHTAISGGTVITTDTVFTRDTTVYAHWNYNGSSEGGPTSGDVIYPSGGNDSGSSTSTPSYGITTPSVTGGTITISPKSATKGTVVTITAKPDSGYELVSLTIIDSSDKKIALTDQGNGRYTFTMPGDKVTVNAEFQPVSASTTEPTPENSWNNPFTDIAESSWYYEAVRYVSENGLMNGVSSTVFAPEANLSRAMLAQILYNKEGRPSIAANSTFTDVISGEWYNDAVTWAATNNIVGGYGNGLFGPNDNITREQLAVMLWRYAGEPATAIKELNFSDVNEASGYTLNALCWATENGIINGKGNNILDPKGCATRAQVAQMLKNYLAN